MSRITKKDTDNIALSTSNFFINSDIPGNKILVGDKDHFQHCSMSIKKLEDLNNKLNEDDRETEWKSLNQEIVRIKKDTQSRLNEQIRNISSTSVEDLNTRKKQLLGTQIGNMERYYVDKFRYIKPLIDEKTDQVLQTRIKKNNTQILPYFDRNIRRSRLKQNEPPVNPSTQMINELGKLSAIDILDEKAKKIAGKVEWLATVVFGSFVQIGQNMVIQATITGVVTATGIPAAGGFLVGASILMIVGMGKEYIKRKADPTTIQDELELKSLLTSGMSYVAMNSLTLLSPAAIGPEYGITMETLFGSSLENIIPFSANGFMYKYTQGVLRNTVPMGINVVLFGSVSNGRQQRVMLAETAFNDPEEAKLAIDWALLFKKKNEREFDAQFFIKRYTFITDSTVGIIAKLPFKFLAKVFDTPITIARWVSDKLAYKAVGQISWLSDKKFSLRKRFQLSDFANPITLIAKLLSTFYYIYSWIMANTVDRLGIGNISRVILTIFTVGFVISVADSTFADGETRELFNAAVRKALQYFSELFTSEDFYSSIAQTNFVIPMVNPYINDILKNNLDSVVSFLVVSIGISYSNIPSIVGNLNVSDIAAGTNMDNFTKLQYIGLSLLGGWVFIKGVKKFMGSDLPDYVKQIYDMPEGPDKEQALNNLALSSRSQRINKFSKNPSKKELIKRNIESTVAKVLDKINFYDFMTSYELRYGDTALMRQNSETISQFLLVDCFMQQEVARLTENFSKTAISNARSLSTNAYNMYFPNDDTRSISKEQFLNQKKQIETQQEKLKVLIKKTEDMRDREKERIFQQLSIPKGGNLEDYADTMSKKKFDKAKASLDKHTEQIENYENQQIGINEYKHLLDVSLEYSTQINTNGFGAGVGILIKEDAGKTITPTSPQTIPDKIIIPNFPRGGGMISFFTSSFIQTQTWWKDPKNERRKLQISKSFTDVLDRIRENDPNMRNSRNIVDNAKNLLSAFEVVSQSDLIESDRDRDARIKRKDKAIDIYVENEKQKYKTEKAGYISKYFSEVEIPKKEEDAWRQNAKKMVESQAVFLSPKDKYNLQKAELNQEIIDANAQLSILKTQYKSLDMDLASVAMQNYIGKDSEFDHKDKVRFASTLESTYKFYNDFNTVQEDIIGIRDRFVNADMNLGLTLSDKYKEKIQKLREEILKPTISAQDKIDKEKEIEKLRINMKEQEDVVTKGRVHNFNKDPRGFLIQYILEEYIPGTRFIQTSLKRGTDAIIDFVNLNSYTANALSAIQVTSYPLRWAYRNWVKPNVISGGEGVYQRLKELTASGLKKSQLLALMASKANSVKRGRISDVISNYSNNIKEFHPESKEKDKIIESLETFNDLLNQAQKASDNQIDKYTESLTVLSYGILTRNPEFEESVRSIGKGDPSEVAKKIATDIMTDISTQIDVMTEIDIDLLTDFAYAFDRPDIDLSSLTNLSPSNNVNVPPEPPLEPTDSQEFRKFTTSSLGVSIEEGILEYVGMNQTGQKQSKLNALIPAEVQKIWKERAAKMPDSRMYKTNMLWMAYDKDTSSKLEDIEVDMNMLLSMTRTTQFLRNMDLKSGEQYNVDTNAANKWFNDNAKNSYAKYQYSEARRDELNKDALFMSTNLGVGDVDTIGTLESKGIGYLDAIRISDLGLLRIVNYGKTPDEQYSNINDLYKTFNDPLAPKPKVYWNNPHVLDLFSSERAGMNAGDAANKGKWIEKTQLADDLEIIKSKTEQILDIFKQNKDKIDKSQDDVGFLLKDLNRHLTYAVKTDVQETVETDNRGYTEWLVSGIFGTNSYLSNSAVIEGMDSAKRMYNQVISQTVSTEGNVSLDEELDNQPVIFNRDLDGKIQVTKVGKEATNADADAYASRVVRQNIGSGGWAGGALGSTWKALNFFGALGITAARSEYNTATIRNGRFDISLYTNMRNLCSTLDTFCPPADASVGEVRDLIFDDYKTTIADEGNAVVRQALDSQIKDLEVAILRNPNSPLIDAATNVIKSYETIHSTSKARAVRKGLYSSLGTGRLMDRGYVQKDEDLFMNFLSWRQYQGEVNAVAVKLNDKYFNMYNENRDLIDKMRETELV